MTKTQIEKTKEELKKKDIIYKQLSAFLITQTKDILERSLNKKITRRQAENALCNSALRRNRK